MKSINLILVYLFVALTSSAEPFMLIEKDKIGYRKEVSQYGITWTFDKPVQAGQFITGDWWVVGPVKIIKISPSPGPVQVDESVIKINHWNDTSLKTDTTMRNGSMIVLQVGKTHGYDSRSSSFMLNNSVKLPLELTQTLSLISSISNTTLPVDQFSKNILWEEEAKSQTVMKTAAVLTCLDKTPPFDAFRPPYAGTQTPIF